MKKIYIIFLGLFILVGCKKTVVSEYNVIMQLESDLTIVQNDIESMSKTNNQLFKYDKKDVGKYDVTLYLYYLSTCPHCHSELEWLNSVKDKYKYLKIVTKEVSENGAEYDDIVDSIGIIDYHVPLTIIGSTYYIGYSEERIEDFIETIEYYSTFDSCDIVDFVINTDKDIKECKQINKK